MRPPIGDRPGGYGGGGMGRQSGLAMTLGQSNHLAEGRRASQIVPNTEGDSLEAARRERKVRPGYNMYLDYAAQEIPQR